MPVMNGIDLIKQAKQTDPNLVFIMLTNLQEFDLVREAMRLGAVDYLTKMTLDPDVLLHSLQAAQKRVDENHKLKDVQIVDTMMHEKQTNALKTALCRLISPAPLSKTARTALQKHQVLSKYAMIQITFCMPDNNENQSILWQDETFEKLADNHFAQHLFFHTEDQALMLAVWGETPQRYPQQIQAFMRSFKSVSQNVFGASSGVLSTSLLDGEQDRDQLLQQLDLLRTHHYLYNTDHLYFPNMPPLNPVPLGLNGIAARLKLDLNSRNLHACSSVLEYAISRIEQLPHERDEAIWVCNELYTTCIQSLVIKDRDDFFDNRAEGYREIEHLGTRKQVVNWLTTLRNEVTLNMEPLTLANSDILEKARQYVRDHLHERIFLQDAAKHACISPSYLSALFKKHYKQNFIDFVNQTKMEHACTLIQTGQYRMNEIAYMLSFENAYYFSKVFRRYIGVSPTEYLQQYQAGESKISKTAEK